MTRSCWMLTAGGRDYTLTVGPAIYANTPHIEDIAHHLAQINRFTGAASRPYSVAEHSLLVERIGAARGATPILRLALLMHDAHEAFTNDLSSPAKAAVGVPWHCFESAHQTAVRHHFKLRTAFAAYRDTIRDCDLIALATERRDLTRFDPARNGAWPILDTPGQWVEPSEERLDANDPPLDWRGMRDAFLTRFEQLSDLIKTKATA